MICFKWYQQCRQFVGEKRERERERKLRKRETHTHTKRERETQTAMFMEETHGIDNATSSFQNCGIGQVHHAVAARRWRGPPVPDSV